MGEVRDLEQTATLAAEWYNAQYDRSATEFMSADWEVGNSEDGWWIYQSYRIGSTPGYYDSACLHGPLCHRMMIAFAESQGWPGVPGPIPVEYFIVDPIENISFWDTQPLLRGVYSVYIKWKGIPSLTNKLQPEWGVYSMGCSVSVDLSDSLEPLASSRSEEWMKEHRFTFDDALDVARRFAEKVVKELEKLEKLYGKADA